MTKAFCDPTVNPSSQKILSGWINRLVSLVASPDSNNMGEKWSYVRRSASLMYLSPQLIKRQFHCKVAVSTILTTKTCIICLHEVQAADF